MTRSPNRKPAGKRQRDYIPDTVPLAATPTGETPGIDQWAHPAVWTDRMLATLLEDKVRVPQGAVLSPVLSNAYLNPLDHRMAESGFQMVRYADDFVILCRSREEADAALAAVREWVDAQGLKLHPEKTHIVDAREESFSFLGYSFRGDLRFPRAKSHRKFMDRIRELTPRKSGHSLEFMIQRINRATRGWFNYFRHCHWNIFRDYDGVIRRRLRRMLLKRHRRNRKRLPRKQRWPNAYFTERGYISLNASHVRFVQSTGTY
jgi:RNA-directed DNA polymerase